MIARRRLKRSDSLLSENLENSEYNPSPNNLVYKKNSSNKDIKNSTTRCMYRRNNETTIPQKITSIEFYKTPRLSHIQVNSRVDEGEKLYSLQNTNHCNPKNIDNRKKSAIISNKTNHIFKYNKELNHEMESEISKSFSVENSFSIENTNSNVNELNNFKPKGENIKDKINIFINLIKKYSDKLITLSKLISSNKNNSNTIYELIKTIEQLNEMINNPKLNSDFFNVNDYSPNIEKKEKENKYEKEYEMMLSKNSELTKENTFLKNELNKEKKNCEEIINKFSMSSKITNELTSEISKLKFENDSLIKNCDHLNQVLSEINKKKNFAEYENELIYKDNVIKYLENLLKKSDISQKMLMNNNYKEEIRKHTLMKKKEKMNKVENNKQFTTKEDNFHENTKENINKNKSKSNNKVVKKEIDYLDEEIYKLQNRIKKMMKKKSEK